MVGVVHSISAGNLFQRGSGASVIQKNPQLQACGSSRIRCFPETAVTGGPYDSDENGVCPAAGG